DLARIKTLLKEPKVVDLRNVYEPEAMAKLGFEYVSVGRADKHVERTGIPAASAREKV
ncbi:MAG: hypothetical protein HY956_05985, partial [Deltaproteobacteria bacterium]|nr:hypothetical protein [Deltaproteobacteria bacterium]